MKWCISSTRFTVLINGTPIGFFQSSRGRRQGDHFSLFLFILAMEALSSILKGLQRLASLRVSRPMGEVVSHLLFVNDTLIFCDSYKEHLEALSWAFMWFEAISGLKINLDKSELIPVGEVSNAEELARVVECKVGSLPSTYLGLPLGTSFKSLPV